MFKLFKKKSIDKKANLGKELYASETLYKNNDIHIVSDACKVCWDTKGYDTYEDKCTYIAKRIKTGHESVIEHSNVIIQMVFPIKEISAVLEFLSAAHYLNCKSRVYGENIYLLVGGSIRGYKEAFRNIIDMTNVVLSSIKSEFYMNLDKCYFADFIEAGIMTESMFGYYPDEDTEAGKTNRFETSDSRVDIVNVDKIDEVASKMWNVFSYDDLMDMCTVTIIFDKMSRIITQQLTRHRNGITQESARYVDMGGVKFNSPELFTDKYEGKKFKVSLLGEEELLLQEIGDKLLTAYSELRDQGLLKEDARGYLPQNYASGKVYMTFTYRHLFKFLSLRTHPSAQAEIRQYAVIIYKALNDYFNNTIGNMYKFLDPMYLMTRVSEGYEDVDKSLSKKIHTIEEDIKEALEPSESEEIILNTVDSQDGLEGEDI